ncbi:hypothetical protein TRFO_09714 [Tritrichomonas foetus]|uniref:Uncharacterized protein n=1 Tax=Tritrichomonas foetus TaxID=1144522 RepID=A0A1J4JHX0_9EUKA|nr:hypothetical protein TRFO_09714 [Tritrichomonas foetus]|eukprot:OHS96828.1 hypothetical protein TRFO_09714 [Tritrichomonas foetus]
MIDPDPNQTSTKVRNYIYTAIEQYGRPISVHEYERWIQENDSELWDAVSQKCYDYTRIILTQTSKDMIVKYHSSQPIEGIDSRSVFYGLSANQYDDNIWVELNDKNRSKKRKKKKFADRSYNAYIPQQNCNEEYDDYFVRKTRLPTRNKNISNSSQVLSRNSSPSYSPQEKIDYTSANDNKIPQDMSNNHENNNLVPNYSTKLTIETSSFEQKPSSIEDMSSQSENISSPEEKKDEGTTVAFNAFRFVSLPENTNDISTETSWNILSNELSFMDPFWHDLINALTKIRDYVQSGYSIPDIVNTITSEYLTFQNENILKHAVNIIYQQALQMTHIIKSHAM